MDSNDFNKLIGLLSKLNAATSKAKREDGCFSKYHTSSIEILNDLPTHIRRLEQGLRTARVLKEVH